MLRLVDIKKDYKVSDEVVSALKGISINFRESEFVAILGPSGCGKTTLLNIVGGLDHATSGDLFIDGISTKNYKDRDWDTYRNKRIGFIFQSYNLIPHETILENVELALNISGISKKERIKRSKEILVKVGLGGKFNKYPNQLSGGQCQRVAIARALVNNPEIILADEPTGALDSITSLQVMDLLKEISKNHLVIMVTHNADLANKYATRIINLLDGEVTNDSFNYTEFDKVEENEFKKVTFKERVKNIFKKENENKKSKLSFFSAFKLSIKNLISKYKRTLMICFAGSIGIIGVGSVLSISSGVNGFISNTQKEMLSGNPLQVNESGFDLNSLLENMTSVEQSEAISQGIENGYINVDKVISYLIKQGELLEGFGVSNNISNEYVDYLLEMPKDWYSAIGIYYDENLNYNVYTDIKVEDANGNEVTKIMSLYSIINMYTDMLKNVNGDGINGEDIASLIPLATSNFSQIPNNLDIIEEQYDIISDSTKSHLATKDNEIMLVVDKDSSLSDIFLGQYGYFSQKEFLNLIYKDVEGLNHLYDEELDKETNRISYDDLLNKTFTYYPNDDVFKDLSLDSASTIGAIASGNYLNEISDEEILTDGIELKITAILRPKEDVNYSCLSSGIFYTPALSEKIREINKNSQTIKFLNDNNLDGLYSIEMMNIPQGITYNQEYYLNGERYNPKLIAGGSDLFSSLMGQMQQSQHWTVYSISLRELGAADTPSRISIYPKNLDYKNQITEYLDKRNEDIDLTINGSVISSENRANITYTDNVEVIMSLISSMVNIVSYALVAFTALSLVVSTVMIAIITYVSVIERIKEIGVIRALGGRKIDVARLFNAETCVIGLISGIIGVAITYLLSLILNLIVGNLSGIYTIASLPIWMALVLIFVSIILTLISGLIPASIASKKDPVEALRAE